MWRHASYRLSSLVLTGVLAACGGGSGDPAGHGTPLARGYTACGDFPDFAPKTCQPNQYCADEIYSECELGCLSDDNCLEGQRCLKTLADVGSCQGEAPSVDQLARCTAACTVMVQCGLVTGAEGAQCVADCQGANDALRQSVADCVAGWSACGPLPGCMAAECGPSYPCGGGRECVDHQCL